MLDPHPCNLFWFSIFYFSGEDGVVSHLQARQQDRAGQATQPLISQFSPNGWFKKIKTVLVCEIHVWFLISQKYRSKTMENSTKNQLTKLKVSSSMESGLKKLIRLIFKIPRVICKLIVHSYFNSAKIEQTLKKKKSSWVLRSTVNLVERNFWAHRLWKWSER